MTVYETVYETAQSTPRPAANTGTSPHGQGHETSWAQITADALGVSPDDIEVLHGDTAVAPMGRDTYGSRSLSVGGVAIHLACEKVVEKGKKIAAHPLEASEADMEFEGGAFSVAGSPDQSIAIQEIADKALLADDLPEGMEPGLNEQSAFDPPNFTWPFGTHICVVEVDTETGKTEIVNYVAVDDCGPVVNPDIVNGQFHGGIAQGIAQALYKEAVYDENSCPKAYSLTPPNGAWTAEGIPSRVERMVVCIVGVSS